MKLPWDLIHKLDHDYEKWSDIPDDNQTLIRIQQITNSFNDSDLNEQKAIELLNAGYGRKEIVDNFGITKYYVDKVIEQHRAKQLPQFKYVITKKGQPRVFSPTYVSYETIIKARCYCYKTALKNLKKHGFCLRKARKIIRFKDLKSGDQYLFKNRLYTKE